MKKRLILASAIFIIVTLIACNTPNNNKDKPVVMTTLFPQYDFARQIAEDYIELEFLLPPGTDAHTFEPSPRTVARIIGADLLIYTGDDMEPWVSTLIRSSRSQTLKILDLSENVQLITDHHGHDNDSGDFDPHIWADPINAMIMVNDILDALIELLPEHEESMRNNANITISELQTLHEQFLDLRANAQLDVVMYGGHNAMGYFIHRYNLRYVNPYRGFSTDSEPTPQALAQMIDLMNELNIEHLFSEKLIAPNVANAIAENTGATILYVYTMHNAPADEFHRGITFVQMMQHNLNQFRIGLKYDGS